MATIKNKRQLADVTIPGENYTLQGEVQFDESTNRVMDLNLVFRKNADTDTTRTVGNASLAINPFNMDDPVDRTEIVALLAQAIQELNEGTGSNETEN